MGVLSSRHDLMLGKNYYLEKFECGEPLDNSFISGFIVVGTSEMPRS